MDPALTGSFRGVAFCHIPADEPIRLEKLVSCDGENDRWNRPGEPTVYLATELPLALAELARHLEVRPADPPVRRRLLGLSLEIGELFDVRRAEVRRALGGPDDVERLRDREVARQLAGAARAEPQASGLLVPSIAFLDDPARANLVLFIDRLGGDMAALVRAQHEAGVVEIRPSAMRG